MGTRGDFGGKLREQRQGVPHVRPHGHRDSQRLSPQNLRAQTEPRDRDRDPRRLSVRVNRGRCPVAAPPRHPPRAPPRSGHTTSRGAVAGWCRSRASRSDSAGTRTELPGARPTLTSESGTQTCSPGPARPLSSETETRPELARGSTPHIGARSLVLPLPVPGGGAPALPAARPGTSPCPCHGERSLLPGGPSSSRGGVCPPPRHTILGRVCSVSHVLLHRPQARPSEGPGVGGPAAGRGLSTPWWVQPRRPRSPHLAPVHLPPGLQGAGGRVSPLLRAGAGLGRAVLAGAGLRVLLRGTAGRPGLLRGLRGTTV